MSGMPRIFARQMNPGVVLSQELTMKIYNYDQLEQQRISVEDEIKQIRKKQESMEDSLAEALAEEEFQRCLNGQYAMPKDEELLIIFKQQFNRTLDKLASSYDRKIYLDIDIRKLKVAIDKGIEAANQVAAAANN